MRSDGIIGSYRALERFYPPRKSSFRQHATYWVHNEIAAGALRSRVVSLTSYGQRRARKDEATFVDDLDALPFPELSLISLDAAELAPGSEGEAGTLHEVLPDDKAVQQPFEGGELAQEWLEILRACPASLRPFLVLRYYYPVWQAEGERAHLAAEVFEVLAPLARERLIAGATSSTPSNERAGRSNGQPLP